MRGIDSKIVTLTKIHLAHRKQITSLARFFERIPEALSLYLNEIDTSILLFNRYQSGDYSTFARLVNADHLKNCLIKGNLPTITQISNYDAKYLERSILAMDEFEFLDSMTPITKFAPAFVIGWYRTYVRTSMPSLVRQNAQIASALEEMLAVLAMKGIYTNIFWATKAWLEDWQGEGFAKEFSEKVTKITR